MITRVITTVLGIDTLLFADFYSSPSHALHDWAHRKKAGMELDYRRENDHQRRVQQMHEIWKYSDQLSQERGCHVTSDEAGLEWATSGMAGKFADRFDQQARQTLADKSRYYRMVSYLANVTAPALAIRH